MGISLLNPRFRLSNSNSYRPPLTIAWTLSNVPANSRTSLVIASMGKALSVKLCQPSVVGLLYTTGLRIGEALRLTLAEVDLKKRVLLVRETKFKKSRYVPLSASAVVQLQGYLRQRRKAGMSTSASQAWTMSPD